ETKHPNRGVECFGEMASTANADLVLGRFVYLEKDVSETDRYDRLLRYVWIGEPDALVMVNEELIRRGFAVVSTYPPDVRYESRFVEAERMARESGTGLWSQCR